MIGALILAVLLVASLPASAKSVGSCLNNRTSSDLCGDNRSACYVDTSASNCVYGQYIQMDCNGGPGDESTADTITATIYEADGTEVARWTGNVGCDQFSDHTFWFLPGLGYGCGNESRQPYTDNPYSSVSPNRMCEINNKIKAKEDPISNASRAKGMYVILSTDGNDAFWLDEMYLISRDGNVFVFGQENTTLAHWGQENGKGYCLSTDPSDAGGDWTNKVDGCHKEIKFVVGGCDYPNKGDNCEDNVYPVRPVSVTGYTVGKVTLTNGTTFSKEAENDEGQLWGEYGANGELAFTYFKMPASNTRYLQLASFPLELGIVLMVDLEEGKVARLNSITGTTDSYGDIKSSTR